jgi:hypothetical protein
MSRNNFAQAKHLMVDIECLGVGTNAAVLQIAAMEFSVEDVGEGRVWNLLLTDPAQQYRRIEPKTLEWWMSQSAEARALVFVPESQKVTPAIAMHDLSVMVEGSDYVWARGPSYDLTILCDLYRSCGLGPVDQYEFDQEPHQFIPWYKWRDERPLRDMLNSLGRHPQMNPNRIGHYALDDVKEQVEIVLSAWDLMVVGKVEGDTP